MKTLLILCMLTVALLSTGCEAIVESREPVRYGTVYNRPVYSEDSRYYYRDGRRYDRYDRENRYVQRERDVVVVNRPVVVHRPDYNRTTKRVIKSRDSRGKYSSDRARDERDRKKKELEEREKREYR